MWIMQTVSLPICQFAPEEERVFCNRPLCDSVRLGIQVWISMAE
jgi:hypothetical protein